MDTCLHFQQLDRQNTDIALIFMQVVAGRQVVVDWAVAKARFTDAVLQDAAGMPHAGSVLSCMLMALIFILLYISC